MYDVTIKPLKSITWLLITLILFQSCISLKNITVDEAIKNERMVRIKTIEGEKYRYKKLVMRDSVLYGVKKVVGFGLVEQDLTQLHIKKINHISPGVTVLNIVLIYPSLLVVALIGCAFDLPCQVFF